MNWQTLQDNRARDAAELLRLRAENQILREQLRRNRLHLQRRTAALVRVIARKS